MAVGPPPMLMGAGMVARLMERWGLVADGAAFETHASTLVPVRPGAVPAMLKLAHSLEEARGGRLMAWWGGQGAAEVLARHGPALLMVRAAGGTLAAVADEVATPVLVEVAGRLRLAEAGAVPRLVGLRRWFRALGPAGVAGDRSEGVVGGAGIRVRDAVPQSRCRAGAGAGAAGARGGAGGGAGRGGGGAIAGVGGGGGGVVGGLDAQ